MKVLIITRKGVIQKVFSHENEFELTVKAEELEGGALYWNRFWSRPEAMVAANSRVDDEKIYSIYSVEAVS